MKNPRWIFAAFVLALGGCNDRALTEGGGGADLGGGSDLAAPLVCGTLAGIACPAGFFCDFASACGGDDSGGACRPIPASCDGANDKQPECGCDQVTYSNSCLRQHAGVSLLHSGACSTAGNACEQAGGYCDPGDFRKPTCKVGYSEDDTITTNNPGVCGLGICCIPGDCRAAGCPSGFYCSGCLNANGGEDFVCIANGSAC